MRKLLLLVVSILIADFGIAQDITFSEHIAPIIFKNCSSCHRDGEIGPMSLVSYDEVKNWSSMIEYVTNTRYMPPWQADPDYSSFLGERALSDEEIDLIAQWVSQGSPEGDPSMTPPLPEFPKGSQVGEPDLVLTFEEAYEHWGGNEDEYRVFVFPTGIGTAVDIAAIELRPGNSNIVHHAIFTYDDSGKARKLDAEDEKYGYESFGGFGIDNVLGRILDGYVPGQKAVLAPEGTGFRLPQGADLLVQMHYAPVPFPETDSSTINIFFKKEPVERYIYQTVLLPLPGTIGEAYLIRPNTVKTFHGRWLVPSDLSLISLTPHMHLLGKSWEIYAVHPSGDTSNLIRINDWDFNWQNTYHFDRFIPVEQGTVVHALATYDNTTNNPSNPSNPPRFMSWGEKTTDEMYFLPINYVNYQPGDEDVVFTEDVTTSNTQLELIEPQNILEPIVPNPVTNEMTISMTLAQANWIQLDLLDTKGQLVKNLKKNALFGPGHHRLTAYTSGIPAGTYFIRLRGNFLNLTQKIVVID